MEPDCRKLLQIFNWEYFEERRNYLVFFLTCRQGLFPKGPQKRDVHKTEKKNISASRTPFTRLPLKVLTLFSSVPHLKSATKLFCYFGLMEREMKFKPSLSRTGFICKAAHLYDTTQGQISSLLHGCEPKHTRCTVAC